MRVLVTAGPTRERLDPVRFLSNRSTGKMGYAVARAARDAGHGVVLVTGPVALPVPDGVEVVRVESAAEMLEALQVHLPAVDALVMAAAVADWRPARVSGSKLKKAAMNPVLELVRTPDILATLAPQKDGRIFVGFAAETDDVESRAAAKLADKGLDMILANDISLPDAGFEVDTNRVAMITADGIERLPLLTKDEVAIRIIRWIGQTTRPEAV